MHCRYWASEDGEEKQKLEKSRDEDKVAKAQYRAVVPP
jgi:hypothetical protein